MKIQNISLINFSTKYKNSNIQNKKQNENLTQANYSHFSTAQYLAFCGGYSIDLAQTYEQLRDEQYPKDIQQAVLKTIQEGNAEDKTLYDIHFEKYKGILDCYSLDELKEKFPEFEGIISANDVEATPESFIGKFQNNELELFHKDEDLTLQLIKLYWGQGFSLNGLSDYIANLSQDKKGIQLRHTLEKLNIPMMNRRYALVLKLSNKEYNEKFTSEMSIRLKEAKEAKLQKAQGEPVVIPRGELSEAHKEHISKGLKKHYQEHPEKIYKMSARQKQFYEENPQKREELSQVTLFAWHKTDEGESVLKGLKKFMKKSGCEITVEELANPLQITGKKHSLLDAFWQKNTWAKNKFSIAMKKGWANQKENPTIKDEPKIEEFFKTVEGKKMRFSLMPSRIRNQVYAWAKERGYNIDDLLINVAVVHKEANIECDELIQKSLNRANKITNEFLVTNEKLANDTVTCLLRTIVKLQTALKEGKKLPTSLQNDPNKATVMDFKLNFLCHSHDLPTPDNMSLKAQTKECTFDEVEEIYSALMDQAVALGCYDFGEYMDKLLDKSYMELKAHGKI